MLAANVDHPPGFRPRRGLNWAFVGLLYTSFYTCRYNFAIANKSISDEFGFNKGQMGTIITTALFAYACGQILNGLLTDRIGGKRAMLIGAAGTVTMNLLFGLASFAGMLSLFLLIRGIDGYVQSFGAPGMVKINAAWFAKTERGRFAGIFGFMINAGRFLINTFGPALLAGFVLALTPVVENSRHITQYLRWHELRIVSIVSGSQSYRSYPQLTCPGASELMSPRDPAPARDEPRREAAGTLQPTATPDPHPRKAPPRSNAPLQAAPRHGATSRARSTRSAHRSLLAPGDTSAFSAYRVSV